ncbi:hypothetical protein CHINAEXTREME_19320 [Halobiforma lacisalsi AJ5]|uniref:Uncharacterized protein n=1 Tax=Natronobacterium lacisalsi AJ5 TaxID=358396 RepID=M0LUK1_NATLA|nr:hypothetical protein [Halobiforma lacisalsi]APW99788.1 hypothetical protein CHINAEXTREME_19320 [Halobiforma lacisalsi AJ5]EMA36034.1 hypothetical protein C445_04233 [Halobiforma lacisalsi AJ5]
MFTLAVGTLLVALGLAGVRYAPAIVETQRRQGMTPIEDSSIETSDRVAVTKGAGVVMAVVGFVLVAYGAGIV